MNQILQETLREDGLRVITKYMSGTKRARITVTAHMGSAYDPPGYDGLAHFFEHLLRKGTKTRSAKDILSFHERYSLGHRATTGHLETVTWGETVYPHFPALCELLFDTYLNSTLLSEEIEKEREVIANEIMQAENDDNSKAHFVLWELLWRDNPLRNWGGGTLEGINHISRDLLFDTYQKWYVSSNTTIVATGKINHDDVVRLAYKVFPYHSTPVELRTWDHESFESLARNEEVIERPGREQAVILFGCKVPPLLGREQVAAYLLGKMLGYMLFEEVVEKRGIAYSCGGSLYTYHHKLGYYYYFTARVLKERIGEAKELVRDIVSTFELDEGRFKRQKESWSDRLLVAFEMPKDWEDVITTRVLNENYGLSSLFYYIQRRKKMLSGVRFEDVMTLRNKLVLPERLACVVIKPV